MIITEDLKNEIDSLIREDLHDFKPLLSLSNLIYRYGTDVIATYFKNELDIKDSIYYDNFLRLMVDIYDYIIDYTVIIADIESMEEIREYLFNTLEIK